jgi:hypothetical protein
MSAHQAWLEAPYTARDREEAAYERFCEREDLDPAENHWDAFTEAMEDAAEDYAAEAAEAAREAAWEDDRYY